MRALQWDDECAQELRDELEMIGLYLELDDSVTACYHLIESESALQKEFDRYAQWKWMCHLIEADSEDVSGDLYRYFAENPKDFVRLPHRKFEEFVSSVFAARGWKTELGPGSGDQGVDLRIWQTDPIGDLLTLVQIKRYSSHRPIQLEAVAALDSHVAREGANRGLFVTSSRYLPGVHEFESKKKYQLTLADSVDLQRWCEQSEQTVRTARNRALALESLGPLMQEIRQIGRHPQLVVSTEYGPSFCIILRETKTSALLAHIPSERLSGDNFRGEKVPLLNGQIREMPFDSTVFRAIRSEKDGRVSYWGQRSLYQVWDGQPCAYDTWD